MTTAHRPTFYSAIGGKNQSGNLLVSESLKVSARDLPSHKKLKTRFASVESEYLNISKTSKISEPKQVNSGLNDKSNAWDSINADKTSTLFPEDEDFNFKSSFEGDVDSINSDDEDDDIDLLKEFAKLKEKAHKQPKTNEDVSNDNLELSSEPKQISILEKWTNDCVFKNQAKKAKRCSKTFINDTIRSEFHKTFLTSFIR